jgi:hypothetical protein
MLIKMSPWTPVEIEQMKRLLNHGQAFHVVGIRWATTIIT